MHYGWRVSVDLYGGDQTISVSIGSEQELKKKQKVSNLIATYQPALILDHQCIKPLIYTLVTE